MSKRKKGKVVIFILMMIPTALFFTSIATFLNTIAEWGDASASGNPTVQSLGNTESEEYYTNGGFQDYTDFYIYRYAEIDADSLTENEHLQPVTEVDAAELKGYINDYEEWVALAVGTELAQNYCFSADMIHTGDYFNLFTYHGMPIGSSSVYRKYDNYSIYYLDVEGRTLYYFHNNI